MAKGSKEGAYMASSAGWPIWLSAFGAIVSRARALTNSL